MEKQVKPCQVCAKEACSSREPMIKSQLPDYPWQNVGSELFKLGASTFLLVVDYVSRFVETSKLTIISSSSIITFLKPIFARYGIPTMIPSFMGYERHYGCMTYIHIYIHTYIESYGSNSHIGFVLYHEYH